MEINELRAKMKPILTTIIYKEQLFRIDNHTVVTILLVNIDIIVIYE